MALPFPVAAGTTASRTNAGTITPGVPAGTQPNDILVLVTCSGSTAFTAPAAPTGYTEQYRYGSQVAVHWKRAGASESAPTLTCNTGGGIASIFSARGCVTTGNPFDGGSTPNTFTLQSNWTVPATITNAYDDLIVALLHRTGTGSSNFFTPPAPWTEGLDFGIATASLSYAAAGQDVPGSTGTFNWTNASASGSTAQFGMLAGPVGNVKRYPSQAVQRAAVI